MTRREIVLSVLGTHANRWVSGKTLVDAGGGWRFGARIDELRKAGHVIESRPDPEHRSAIHEYRLVVADVAPGQTELWDAA